MGLLDDIASDLDTVMEDLGESFVVELSEAPVKEVVWLFVEEAEVVDPYDSERLIVRPIVVVPSGDISGIDKTHTFRRVSTDVLYKLYGDPVSDGMGMAQMILVKA